MPYETTWETSGVIQKFRGVVSSPEWFDALKEIYSGPRLDSFRYVLRDFLDVEVFDVGIKMLLEGRAASTLIQERAPDIVVAVVTTRPEIIESMKVASSYGLDVYPSRIFPNVAEARAWIAGFQKNA